MSDAESQEITLYIADVELNRLMKSVDLKPDYKWYIVEQSMTVTGVNDATIEKLKEQMRLSRDNDDFYVAAFQFRDDVFFDEGVKELSDGTVTMFIHS